MNADPLPGAGTILVLLAAMLGLAACDARERPAPLSSEPQSTSSAVPTPAPGPGSQAQLQNELAKIGGVQTDRGWMVLLPSARFNAREVTFDATDSGLVQRIAALIKNSQRLRILVTVSEDDGATRTQRHETAERHAEAVRSALSAAGADESRIQAQGSGDESASSAAKPPTPTVALIISNVAGEFPTAPPASA